LIDLYLIRHGNTFSSGEAAYQIGSKTDLDLSQSGQEQAVKLGKHFSSLGIEPSAVFSGNLTRHKQTAAIFLENLGLENQEVLIDEGLNEIDFGAWEKLRPEEINEKWTKEYADWNETAAWAKGVFGQSEEEVLGGIQKFLTRVSSSTNSSKQDGKESASVIAFSSGGLIRYFYSFISAEWRKYQRERMMKSLKVKTGHYCQLELSPIGLKVKSWSVPPGNI